MDSAREADQSTDRSESRPEPRTMFRDVRRIEAGTYSVFTGEGQQTTRYWDPAAFAIEKISPRDAINETRRLIERARPELWNRADDWRAEGILDRSCVT